MLKQWGLVMVATLPDNGLRFGRNIFDAFPMCILAESLQRPNIGLDRPCPGRWRDIHLDG